MTAVWADLRYAFRQLRKSPGFTATAALTLAVGIGATTAIFTLVYDVLKKPLPYPHPEQLVVMEEQVAELRNLYPTLPMNANHFMNWQQHSHSLQSMAVMQQGNVPLGGGGHPLQVGELSATSGIFSVLDASPQLGRAFTAQEDQPGHEHVVVLMHDLWKRQFHSDPGILGKTITLDGYPYTVIGVMAPSFRLPDIHAIASPDVTNRSESTEAIVPIAFSKDRLQEAMGDFNYFGLARLKPGVSVAQANAEVNALQHTIAASLPADEHGTLSAVFTPFQQYLVGNNGKSLGILLAAVAGLLFVGCINIANLLLARAVGRRQELAVAAALGASRSDLARASIREASVLAGIGGALGILLAVVTVPILQRFLPAALNFRGNLHVDWAGAGFAVLLAAAATLLAGVAPAWMSWHTQPQSALRSDSRSASESRGGKRLRKTLVAAEVVISVALVLITGLLTTSLFRLLHIGRGFDTARVLTAQIYLPYKYYSHRQDHTAFYKRALDRLTRLPGVEHAAIVSVLPLTGDGWGDWVRLPGDARSIMQLPLAQFRWVSPGYFEAIHLRLIAGRFLSGSDEGKNYALVSQLTAKALWPGKNPIGRQFNRGDPADSKLTQFTVIGIVGDARTVTLAKPDPMMVYVPYWYRADSSAGLVVRTRQDPAEMASAIRKTIWSVDPAVAVPTVRMLGGMVADSVATRRFEMDLLLLFAISAWLLAGLGVYGVLTYSVAQRRQEIGLRMALGAQRTDIYAQVLREGLTPVVAGAVVGIAVAFAFARLIGSLLFQVNAFNPWIASSAAASLLLAGVAACLLPARRAASVDPMQALRSE